MFIHVYYILFFFYHRDIDREKRSVTFAPSVTIVQEGSGNNTGDVPATIPTPYNHYTVKPQSTNQHQSTMTTGIKPTDNPHHHHGDHPSSYQYYNRHGNSGSIYHTPSSQQPKLHSHHSHSQSKLSLKEPNNTTTNIASLGYKQQGYNNRQRGDIATGLSIDNKDQAVNSHSTNKLATSNSGSVLSSQQQGSGSKVHTNKSLVQSQYSVGGRQHDQSKATLLQQQVMRLQQLESMKGAGRQSTDVQSKHDQPVVASGNGMGVAYTRHHDPPPPHQSANKPLKRTSLPLPLRPPSSPPLLISTGLVYL